MVRRSRGIAAEAISATTQRHAHSHGLVACHLPRSEYREVLADTTSEFKVFQQTPRQLTVSEDRNGWLITKHGSRYILRKRMRKTDKYRTQKRALTKLTRRGASTAGSAVRLLLSSHVACDAPDGRTVKSGHMKAWSSSDSEGDEDMTVNTGRSKPSAASTVNSQQQQQGDDVCVHLRPLNTLQRCSHY